MKKLFLLIFCSHAVSCAFGQFDVSYKAYDISAKISYPIAWHAKSGFIVAYDSISYMQNKDKTQRIMTSRIVQKITKAGVEEYRFTPLKEHGLERQFVEKFLALDKAKKVDYYIGNGADGTFEAELQVSYHEVGKTTEIMINTGGTKPGQDPIKDSAWTTGKFVTNPNLILATRKPANECTGKQLRDVFRIYTIPRVLYLEAGLMPAIGGRTLQVMNRKPDLDKYSKREQNEIGIFNFGAFLKLGFDIDGRNSFYLSGVFLQQGFSAQSHSVNWSNGLSATTIARRYDLHYSGFETGYSFNPFNEHTAFSSDVGLHFLFVSGNPGTNTFSWGPHLSIGPKFRIGGRVDLRVLPTCYLNLRRLETRMQTMELATRLYTIGLKIAIRQYF